MNTLRIISSSIALLAAILCFAAVRVAESQTVTGPPSAFGQAKGSATSPANLDAEREQIWNSADMLRARAWLKDYCSKSAKVTPDEAKEYETELANMTPKQMKIWLMKFDEEEQQRHQQYAMFQQANEAGLKQAMAAHRQTQQAYAALNQAQTTSAQNEQQQIDVQREEAQTAAEDKRLDQSPVGYGYGPGYGPYGFSPYGPYGYGGIHYHYHFYGN